MNRIETYSIQSVASLLAYGEEKLKNSRVTVGFDGFIDILVRPIEKTAQKSEDLQYYKTIETFGKYLSAHKGVSCSVETEVFSRKFGGNAPHFSNALSHLGVPVDCIGAFGKDKIDPVFSPLNFHLYSFDDPGFSTALEFNDGKVLLGERISKDLDWKAIEECTASAGLHNLILEADLLALVNWSELSYSTELWERVLMTYIIPSGVHMEKYVFFDLCDISRKADQEIRNILHLIEKYSKYRKTILSLNRNEANLVGNVLAMTDSVQIGEKLYEQFGIGEVLVHSLDSNILISEDTLYMYQNCRVANPKVLTGAGDNFNGAYCASLLLGLEAKDRLWFASKFAEEYVKTGEQPSLATMGTHAQNQKTA